MDRLGQAFRNKLKPIMEDDEGSSTESMGKQMSDFEEENEDEESFTTEVHVSGLLVVPFWFYQL